MLARFFLFWGSHMSEPHYTDKHLPLRGSSLDIIQRCVVFLGRCGDFEGILDYAEDENNPGKFQKMLHALEHEAMRIIHKESTL